METLLIEKTSAESPASIDSRVSVWACAIDPTLSPSLALVELGVAARRSKDLYQSLFKDFMLPKDDEAFNDVRDAIHEVFFKILVRSFTLMKKSKQLAHKFSFTFKPSIENVKTLFTKLIEVESICQHMRDEGEKPYTLMVIFSDLVVGKNNSKD